MEASLQASPPSSVAESSPREDVRTALFSELRDKGLLDSVKAQLRGKVVQELQSLVRDRPSCKEVKVCTRRWGRLCMSVLGEYLERMGLEYTLSVLVIEGDTSKEGMMGRGEVEEVLGVGVGGRDSVLTALIEETAKDRGIKKRNIHTQTQQSHTDKSGLAEKLQEIERAYSELSDKERRCGHLSMQEKMLSYQRECQRRANEQTRADMARFKERELAALRLESEDRIQEEVKKSRREFEVFYQERLKALQQRERNMMDGMKKRETELDATLYAQRQKILDELESVKNRELHLRRQFETEERGVLGERERLRNLEQELRLREMSLENVSKLKDTEQSEVLMVKRVQLEKEYEEKRKSIEIQEATLREERRSLSQLEGICSQQMKEASELRTQLYKLQEAVRFSTEAQFCAEREKQDVIRRVEKMGDYNVLKTDNIRLENEAYLARREIDKQTVIHEERVKDYESRLSDLRSKLHQPSEESHEMNNKLLHERQTRERERALSEKVCKQLELRLDTSENLQNCLKDALKDHQALVKQLTQELTELKVRTGNISKSRIGKETFEPHPLKSSLRPHSSHPAPQLIPEHPDPFIRPKSTRVRIKLPSTPDTTLNEVSDHSLSEISFVQEAKSSLERLEREALELELSYKNVHNRILRGSTIDDPIQSILMQYQQPFTSTIDPRTFLLERNVPNTTSLTSLTDVDLSAGVNQSLISESEKFTDLISSCTPLDTVPLLPLRNFDNETNKYLSSITEPFENALETSILAENSEYNEFIGQGLEGEKLIEIADPEKFTEIASISHTLDNVTRNSDVISPVSNAQDVPLITLEPTNSVPTLNTNMQYEHLSVISTELPLANMEHISVADPITEVPGVIVNTVHELLGTDSTGVRYSEHEREREEAIRETLQETERIESELQANEYISDERMENKTLENTGIFPVESGTSQVHMNTRGNTGVMSEESESISGIVPVQNDIPVRPVETEQADTMAMYMQLLSKDNLVKEVTGSSAECNEVSGGIDGSLKSEEVPPVSVAGFSESDPSDPFTDW